MLVTLFLLIYLLFYTDVDLQKFFKSDRSRCVLSFCIFFILPGVSAESLTSNCSNSAQSLMVEFFYFFFFGRCLTRSFVSLIYVPARQSRFHFESRVKPGAKRLGSLKCSNHQLVTTVHVPHAALIN